MTLCVQFPLCNSSKRAISTSNLWYTISDTHFQVEPSESVSCCVTYSGLIFPTLSVDTLPTSVGTDCCENPGIAHKALPTICTIFLCIFDNQCDDNTFLNIKESHVWFFDVTQLSRKKGRRSRLSISRPLHVHLIQWTLCRPRLEMI